ncbi:hypothetical protein [Calidifontibacter indicus]|uniref:hypothetical protein n=1 Tax=Calidifontibacter indicus TaxID=419650 RepID=UPI003D734D6E
MTPNDRPGLHAGLFILDEAQLLTAIADMVPADVFDRWAAGELDPTPAPPRNPYEAASRINDPKRWQQ